jgi:hypothetical protein
MIPAYFRTFGKTAHALASHRLGGMIPFAWFLLLWAIILWSVNAIAPMAPFVYSLY